MLSAFPDDHHSRFAVGQAADPATLPLRGSSQTFVKWAALTIPPLKVISSIEDRGLIDHILAHLEQWTGHEALVPFASRGPPQLSLL